MKWPILLFGHEALAQELAPAVQALNCEILSFPIYDAGVSLQGFFAVLLDDVSLEGNAIRIARTIRNTAALPLLLFVDHDSVVEAQAFELGAKVIRKPISPVEMVETLSLILSPLTRDLVSVSAHRSSAAYYWHFRTAYFMKEILAGLASRHEIVESPIYQKRVRVHDVATEVEGARVPIGI